jgi:serine protease Do
MKLRVMNFPYAIAASMGFWAVTQAEAPPNSAARELRRTPVVKAYERARDSVVNISASGRVEVQRWGMNIFGDLFPVPLVREERSVGSGFVLHQDGYIGTNAHAVSAGAQLSVTLADGTEYEARVIGRDTTRDLAVIKIDPKKPLRPIALGRSDDLMIGEQAIAVGNPVGLQNTVTTGVISALHRELSVEGRVVYPDVIQTDASINPGNSGGPLLNILGEMIGVNTAIRTDVQNIGFAIPVDHLREILPDVLDCEKLNKVVSGLRVGGSEPVKVTQVRDGTPADQAGIRVGDLVLELDGRPLNSFLDFYVGMLDRRPGDTVSLTLSRIGRTVPVRLALAEMPKPDGPRLAQSRLGLTVADAKDEVARRFQLKRQGGVIVLSVEPGSPADRAGMQPGDLIITLGRNWMSDVDQLGAALAAVEPGMAVSIGFRREHRGRLYDWETRVYAR